MTRRDEFVAAARSYIGTPFHHQGRVPGVGLDCAGVIVCAAKECGYEIVDVAGYGRIPANGMLERMVAQHCDSIPFDQVKNGDILLFRFRQEPQHLAVFANGKLIHAYSSIGRVVEHGMDAAWHERLVGCYLLKGVV